MRSPRQNNEVSSRWCTYALMAAAVAVVACGPDTAIRERDELTKRGAERSTSVEAELPTDATWLAVATSGDKFYCLGQPLDAGMVASADRYLLAIDNKGAAKWRADFALPASAVPAYYADLIGHDKVLLFLSDYVITGLSPADGSVLWTIDNQMTQLRFIGIEGDVLYSWAYPTTIYGHSITDGTLVDTWDFQGYSSIFEAWMTTSGKHIVAYVDIAGEQGVALLELGPSKKAPKEVFREPNPYQYQTQMVGPARYSSTGLPTYDRSDYAVKITSTYERVQIEAWSVFEDEPVWEQEIPLNPDDYYSYYAPRFLLGRTAGLVQEPMSEGVILRNVLRLHLHALAGRERAWTNVVPTRQYVNNMMELEGDRILVHTVSDQGDFSDRWYVFSAKSGDLIWTSRDQDAVGQTRAMATTRTHLGRLMTTNWMDSRLFIDTLEP